MLYKPVVNNQGHRPINDGDQLSPSAIAVSATTGNQIAAAQDGLYVGVMNETPVEMYVNSSGVDDSSHGTRASPVRTLDYALAQLDARDIYGHGLSRVGGVYNVMLAAGQAFSIGTSVAISGINLRFGFYGDARGDWNTQVDNSTAEVYEDVLRPTIANAPITNATTGLNVVSRIYVQEQRWPTTVEFHGVKINLTEVGATNLGVVDFVDGADLKLTGCIVNKVGWSPSGLMAIRAEHKTMLRQFASQFQIGGKVINANQGVGGITISDLSARQYFIKFYLGLGGGGYQWQRLLLTPDSLNSTNASGLLFLLWQDSIRQATGSSFSLASYPPMSDSNFGFAQYITNLRRNQQGQVLNVIGGRNI